MKWTKLSLKTTTDAVDLISNMLEELGIEGIEIVDYVPITEEEKKAMFIDILPELKKDNGEATICFYIDPEENIEEFVQKVRVGLKELSMFVSIGAGDIQVSQTEDKDWINNWKQFFKPFRVDNTIVIKPTWESLQEINENDLVIEIDPGTAFGTGSHETTKLCMISLKNYVTEQTKLLDIGCGSGILSILSLKLGAKKVIGIDIDPNAITATYENAQVNKIPKEQFQVYSGNIMEDIVLKQQVAVESYDIVVANILADVIIPLSFEVVKYLKSGGIFITSGIINNKKEEVERAILSNGFQIIEIKELGDWVSIVARK